MHFAAILASETTTMSSFLTMIGEGATWIMQQAASIGQTIVDTPVLAISLVVPILGGAIGIFTRLLHH